MSYLFLYIFGYVMCLLSSGGVFAYRVFPVMDQMDIPISWGNFNRGLKAYNKMCPRGKEMDEEFLICLPVMGGMVWPVAAVIGIIYLLFRGIIWGLTWIYHTTKPNKPV